MAQKYPKQRDNNPVRSAQRRPLGANVRPGSRWVTIWMKYPIREFLRVGNQERTTAALLKTPHGPLIVYGTVLPWHSDRGNNPSGSRVTNWSEQYRVLNEQATEWH